MVWLVCPVIFFAAFFFCPAPPPSLPPSPHLHAVFKFSRARQWLVIPGRRNSLARGDACVRSANRRPRNDQNPASVVQSALSALKTARAPCLPPCRVVQRRPALSREKQPFRIVYPENYIEYEKLEQITENFKKLKRKQRKIRKVGEIYENSQKTTKNNL